MPRHIGNPEVETRTDLSLEAELQALRQENERLKALSSERPQFEMYRLIAHAIDDVVSLHDRDSRFLFVSPSVSRLIGFTPEELLGAAAEDLVHPDDIERMRAQASALNAADLTTTITWRCRCRTGSYLRIETKLKALLDASGQVDQFLWTSRDVTERETLLWRVEEQLARLNADSAELERQKQELEAANVRLAALATLDGLTGLKNHRSFQERLDQEFQRARRYNMAMSLVLLDVDRFKPYNDTFGHPAGDVVLQTVANLLLGNARATDFVSRYGGEEFAIILSNTDADGAISMAERFRLAIRNWPWRERVVTASFGVASLDKNTVDRIHLLRDADQALYTSKQQGRNRTTHHRNITT